LDLVPVEHQVGAGISMPVSAPGRQECRRGTLGARPPRHQRLDLVLVERQVARAWFRRGTKLADQRPRRNLILSGRRRFAKAMR